MYLDFEPDDVLVEAFADREFVALYIKQKQEEQELAARNASFRVQFWLRKKRLAERGD